MIQDTITAYHDTGIAECHIYFLFFHDIADRKIFRMCPPYVFEYLFRTALSLIVSFTKLYHIIITMIPLPPSLIIRRRANCCRKCVIGITVTSHVEAVQAVCVHHLQKFFHLAERCHGSDVGYFSRQPQIAGYVKKFPARCKYSCRIVTDMGGNKPSVWHTGPGRRHKFPVINPRHVAHPIGNAKTTGIQCLLTKRNHSLQFIIGDMTVLIPVSYRFPEPAVSNQESDIDRGPVTVHYIEIADGIIAVDSAFTTQYRRHTHAQHTAENSVGFVLFQCFLGCHEIFMHVDVDKAGRYDLTCRINYRICLRFGHSPAADLVLPAPH